MNKPDLITINDAVKWASNYTNKSVTASNINYLIQYALIDKIITNGMTYISKDELKKYYDRNKIERVWREKLGDDLNWKLSFDNLKESDTTKHVHRLHPYKGKFIPQLVNYFIDSNIDEFKKEVYFKKDDLILDPFCGSGTTLVQANELGINALGIDISDFNTIISNSKIANINLEKLEIILKELTDKLKNYIKINYEFEDELNKRLLEFNNKYFDKVVYKKNIRENKINSKIYSKEKEKEFLAVYNNLIKKYNIKLNNDNDNSFIRKWFIPNIIDELSFMNDLIKNIDDEKIKNIIRIILSRTMRSCRATTHSDIGTLLKPIATTYYCKKHYKICKPIFSIIKWWNIYYKDTIKRLYIFNSLKTNTKQLCITGDSRNINIFNVLKNIDNDFYKLLKNKKISGIFTSPPYIGLIDYHEQHAYAYDLFGFNRNDDFEIGSLSKGQSLNAKNKYIDDISEVLINSKKYMIDNYNVFIVANDKYNLYTKIAEKSNMKIVNTFKRPVLI
ncbi:DNA methyltransferase [uncultured Brachyspira sp.]|uniref:DNA methyltransferase n=2 Tax=uncultured Brachyspira sp. TaxID=221953 RepID=UPI0025DB692D|nr:DNA methyltransferase [uncultured Brachyspira sp.]